MIALETLPDEVRQYILDQQATVAQLTQLLKLKEEEIKLLNFRLFGAKSEKLSQAQMDFLFAEPGLTAEEVQKEADLPDAQKANPLPKAKKPRNRNPGRDKLPAHLERRVVTIPCHPKDCQCARCGAERPVIGYETHEELGMEPAKFFIKEVRREKRGSHCQPEQGVATAPAPARITPKGKLADEFIIEVLARKYQQHLPVYRQCANLAEDYGLDLSRATLTQGVLAAGELLRAVVRAQAEEIKRGAYLQGDETTVPVQQSEKTGKNHTGYLWQYSVPGGPVVFDFQMGRGRVGPAAFLQGVRGVLQCDGYEAYDKLGEGIEYAGCMSHARRGFVDAAKLAPLDPLPMDVLGRFNKLYEVERESRAAQDTVAQRLARRQAQSVPLMTALKERLVTIRQNIMPGTKLAKACDYALGQWSRLEVYLQNGLVEIDNNWCEGGMRPLALGRKNWLHLGSEEAGPKVAAIASIIETCRRLDINLREYLTEVLPKLGDWPINRVAELTPTAWKAAKAKKN